MRNIKEKVISRAAGSQTGRSLPKVLYLTALTVYLTVRALESTMFPRIHLLNMAGLVAAFGLIGLKILFFDGFTVKELLLYAAGLGTGVLSYLHGGNIHCVFILWFVMGSRGIDFEDIIRVYLIVNAAVAVLAFMGSQLGVIEDLVFSGHRMQKKTFLWFRMKEFHALGGIFRTDTAARVFFWFLALFYACGRKAGALLPLIMILVSLALYLVTQGRLDSGCLCITGVLGLLDFLVRRIGSFRLGKVRGFFWKTAGILSMPSAALITCLLTYIYDAGTAWLSEINTLFTGRLLLGKKAIDTYGINLLGHKIDLIGNGGASTGTEAATLLARNYNYVDVSFVQILLVNGLLVLFILLLMYVYTAWKNREDTCMMICIAMTALNCMVAQHLTDLSYVPFILACTAYNGRTEKPK